MKNTLTILGVKDLSVLPKDILDAGKLLDSMQETYVKMPDGDRKNMFATVIAESVRGLVKNIEKRGYGARPAIPSPAPAQQQTPAVPPPSPQQKPKAGGKQQPQPQQPTPPPPPQQQKVTIDDFKALEIGDVVYFNENGSQGKSLGSFKLEVTNFDFRTVNGVQTKEGFIADYEDLEPPMSLYTNVSYNYNWVEDNIDTNDIRIVKATKPKANFTLADIKALQVGDTVEFLDLNTKLTVKNVYPDMVSGDEMNYNNNTEYKDMRFYDAYWQIKIDEGAQIKITKAGGKKQYALDDIKALQVGDTIIFESGIKWVVERVGSGGMYYTLVEDNSQTEDTYRQWYAVEPVLEFINRIEKAQAPTPTPTPAPKKRSYKKSSAAADAATKKLLDALKNIEI